MLKLKTQKIILSCVLLLITTVFVYLTPNLVIQFISPKIYMSNVLAKKLENMSNTFFYNKEIAFSLNQADKTLVDLKLYNNDKSFVIQENNIIGENLGIYKDRNLLKKYLTFKSIYNKCFDVTYNGKKFLNIQNSSSSIKTTNEYILSINKKGVSKIIDLAKFGQKEKILENINDNLKIHICTDKDNRIISVASYIPSDNGNTYTELIFKDDKIQINNLDFLFTKKSSGNILTVNIQSIGNHALANNQFTDKTQMSVNSSYLQVANVNIQTNIDLKKNTDNFNITILGKILRSNMQMDLLGDFSSVGISNKFQFRVGNEKDYFIDKNFTSSFKITDSPAQHPTFKNIFSLTNDELTNIKSNIKQVFAKNFMF